MSTFLFQPNTVGCTAPNPLNLDNECRNVRGSCHVGNERRVCCRDACPKNYCTTTAVATSPTDASQKQEQTSPVTASATRTCLTQSECEEQQQKKGFDYFYTGSYGNYGCFSKQGNLYWGIGGTGSQKASSPLIGAKERVWCEEEI